MCEVKINVENSEEKKSCKIRLVIRTIFHGFCTCLQYFVLAFGGYITVTASEKVRSNEFLNFMLNMTPMFLTNWNYLFQTLFLSLSFLYDVSEWLDRHQTDFGKKLHYYRDLVFSGLVVPFTMFISIMFWSVYTIDRELVFPEVYDQIVPWWFNHCVHTNITIVVGIETVLQARRYPRNRKMELGLVTAINIVYAIVYYSIYFITHRWLYGVFGIMTWWQVCLYQLLIWTSAFFFYFIQFPINRIFHREQVVEEQKSTEVAKSINGDANGDASFPAKSWSLKYRSIGNEHSKL